MPKPLDERIAAAMSQDARIATVAELITEVGEEIKRDELERDRLDSLSKSATTSEAEADAAADQSVKLGRRVIRLNAKREQLEKRHGEIAKSDRQQRLQAEYKAAKERRDELASELAERWPALTDELISLLQRLEVSDRECHKVNQSFTAVRLVSAEALARQCDPAFHDRGTGLRRLHTSELPAFRSDAFNLLAWPQPTGPGVATEVPIP